MKNLTDSAVIDAALDLIKKNGKTTTLDIKRALRTDGYFATQGNISVIMNTLYSSNNLEFVNNGTYREYFEASQSNLGGMNVPSLGGNVSSFGGMNISSPKLSKQPSVPAVETTSPVKGDWKVFENGTPNNCKYYAAGCSRNAARYAFAKGSGFVHYPDTRTCIVS